MKIKLLRPFLKLRVMELLQNLSQNKVSEGSFSWKIGNFFKNFKCSSFKFSRSNSYVVIICDASISKSLIGPIILFNFTLKAPSGSFSVFSKVIYKIGLIDPAGQEFYSHKIKTFIYKENCNFRIRLRQKHLREIILPEDALIVRLSWYSWNKSKVLTERTQIKQDLFSGKSKEPLPTSLEQLSCDFMWLYHSKAYTDCVLRVADVQFPAHQAVLSARSSVFAAMFDHDTSEKLNCVVSIADVEVNVLEDVLKYIYSGKIHGLNARTAASMCELADKYAIFELRDHCLYFLRNNMTMQNVCDAALLAHTHGATELEAKVSQFIEDRIEDIQKCNSWKHFVNAKPSIAVKFLSSSLISCKKYKTKKDGLQ